MTEDKIDQMAMELLDQLQDLPGVDRAIAHLVLTTAAAMLLVAGAPPDATLEKAVAMGTTTMEADVRRVWEHVHRSTH